MAKNTEYVGVTIEKSILSEMKKRAKEEMRSLSSMFAIAAKEYLLNDGKKK